MGTDLTVRSTLDLTRAPDAQWNDEMIQVVAKNVFRGKDITRPQLYYCLNVAESLALNPLIGEIYFLPSKSKDGAGPAWQPYIGRNGLVKKARERGYYYESDTVHEHDKFRIYRKADGSRTCTHSYGSGDRGEIIGAYAFLHRTDGSEKPSFFYAKLSEYLPSYDADWKMRASPWGNTRSAMIEKCSMIGAGRKRLDLGNVLIDAEGAILDQQASITGPSAPAIEASPESFWESIDAPAEVVERLREAVQRANELVPLSWTDAKCEMVMAGRSADELVSLAAQIEREAEILAARGAEPAATGTVEAPVGDASSAPEPSAEGVTEAQVVDEERVTALKRRAGQIEERLNDGPWDEREARELGDELEQVERELAAAEDPDQLRLG